jgi:predicted transposase YdaD
VSFDNLCKLLSEKHPDRFASWILGKPQPDVKVLKNELSIEPIRADYITLLGLQERILHLEFQRQAISTYTEILAGLKFKKALIQQIFREGMMRESVIYQEILEEGRQQGRQQGERSLILCLLKRQVGELPETLRSRIDTLSLEQLESLGEALLDFATIANLEAWFESLA